MDFYKGVIPILDYTPEGRDYAMPSHIEGHEVGYGYVPRDYSLYPLGMGADPPSQMEIIKEGDWDAWYDEEEEQQSSLEHLYLSQGPNGPPVFTNLDQNGDPYCWEYGTGHMLMFNMLVAGGKVHRVNPHSTASILKKGAKQGGWCGLGLQGAEELGMALEGTGPGEWPLHSRDYRRYYTEQMKAEMLKNKSTEQWVDLNKAVYDRNMTRLQIATALFTKNPVQVDYNEWSHSVCGIRWVRVERGSWWPLIINSWRGWGRHGLAVIRNWSIDGAASSRRSNPHRRAA